MSREVTLTVNSHQEPPVLCSHGWVVQGEHKIDGEWACVEVCTRCGAGRTSPLGLVLCDRCKANQHSTAATAFTSCQCPIIWCPCIVVGGKPVRLL